MNRGTVGRRGPLRRYVRVVAVISVATIVVAGCAGSGESTGSTEGTSVTSSSSASTTIQSTTSTSSPAATTTTSAEVEPGSPGVAGLQAIADEAGDALIYVSDADGTTTVVAGEGENDEAIQADDAFFIGSGSKMITAVAVLQLVDQGLVGLDDLLEEYVEFEVSTPITIRHLLQHKSGLGDDGFFYETCDPEEVMEGLAALAQRPYNLEPGGGASYSTNGFNMLSLVISSATGQATAEVFRENLFQPLEMTSTYFTGAEDGPPLVVGGGSWEPDCPAQHMDIGTGGGFASSAEDLDIFMRALFEGDLLTAESLKEMITIGSVVHGLDYGLGIGVLYPPTTPEQPMYGHWGQFGWEAGAMYDPENRRTVVALVRRGFAPTVFESAAWASTN
ncbi:MAG: serine hydrolase domain-containing protein [Acidimicrobiia bacterium]